MLNNHNAKPLAEQMRPTIASAIKGQKHLLGQGKPLARALSSGVLHSMVLWGPPGTGKTTLAYLLAQAASAETEQLSAVQSGVKEIKAVVERAKIRLFQKTKTVLFVDEVHRFSKSQQDAFLPHVEDGTLIFIGATTENPSFELNRALLSRVRVHVLHALDRVAMEEILSEALEAQNQRLSHPIALSSESSRMLVESSGGDARRLLNALEGLVQIAKTDGRDSIDVALVKEVVTGPLAQFDKEGEVFYDTISALHKSIRGSDPDAALYWLARMLQGGCDALYVARRLVRVASEDIGNADPRAMQVTLNAWDVVKRLGNPEGDLALAQAVTYLACAAKSNAVYVAFKEAMSFARSHADSPVPVHLRNAPTALMKKLGHGKAYRYAHDEPHAYAAGERYFPEGLDAKFYRPVARGLEKNILDKLDFLKQLDEDSQ